MAQLAAHLRASTQARGGTLSPLIEGYLAEVQARAARELEGLAVAGAALPLEVRFVGGLVLRVN
jgi:hypothetical protein